MRLSAADLRDIVEKIVFPHIELHRGSRVGRDEDYLVPPGRMSDDEITDFILSNPLLDSNMAWTLADPGLLGFDSALVDLSQDELVAFKGAVDDWATTNEWASGDLVYYHLDVLTDFEPDESRIWTMEDDRNAIGSFLVSAPNHLAATRAMLEKGGSLADLDWRAFEHLVAELWNEMVGP